MTMAISPCDDGARDEEKRCGAGRGVIAGQAVSLARWGRKDEKEGSKGAAGTSGVSQRFFFLLLAGAQRQSVLQLPAGVVV